MFIWARASVRVDVSVCTREAEWDGLGVCLVIRHRENKHAHIYIWII